jgi:hypothetical protein
MSPPVDGQVRSVVSTSRMGWAWGVGSVQAVGTYSGNLVRRHDHGRLLGLLGAQEVAADHVVGNLAAGPGDRFGLA